MVSAIREGRQASHAIDKFLMGETNLPAVSEGPPAGASCSPVREKAT